MIVLLTNVAVRAALAMTVVDHEACSGLAAAALFLARVKIGATCVTVLTVLHESINQFIYRLVCF